MSYKYFPKPYDELFAREPDSQDNPYFVIEHILYCREQGEREDWHDEYINKILIGLLHGNIEAELGANTGGRGSDLAKWTTYHERIDMFMDGVQHENEGYKFNEKGGVAEQLSKEYGLEVQSVKDIFYKKGQLPSKRRTRKTDK